MVSDGDRRGLGQDGVIPLDVQTLALKALTALLTERSKQVLHPRLCPRTDEHAGGYADELFTGLDEHASGYADNLFSGADEHASGCDSGLAPRHPRSDDSEG
eukprot:2469643-Rhodomonas_salina.1